MNFLNSIQSKLHGAVNPNSVQYIKQQDLKVQLDPSGTAYVDHGNQAFSLNVDDENTTALAILDKAPSTQPLSLSGQSQFTICLKHKVQDTTNPLIGQYFTNPQYDLSLSSTAVGTYDTFQVNAYKASDDPVSYSITGDMTSADLSNADLTGTLTNLHTPLSYTLRSGYGSFVFSLDGLSQQVSTTMYKKYWVKSVTNLLGDLVFGFSSTGSTGVYFNQPDLSFGTGGKYMFDITDPTMADLSLVFGTTVDNLSTVNDSVVTRTSDLVIVDIGAGYTDERLVYFEDSSAGMGYVSTGGSGNTLIESNFTNTSAVTPYITSIDFRSGSHDFSFNDSPYTFANGDYTLAVSSSLDHGNIMNTIDENDAISAYHWNSGNNYYYPTGVYTGVYNGTESLTIDGVSYSGDWIEIKMPYRMVLKSLLMGGRNELPGRYPKVFYMVGSNDGGSTYEHIETITTDLTEVDTNTPYSLTIPFSTTTKSYQMFRMIVHELHPYTLNLNSWKDYVPSVNIGRWALTGDVVEVASIENYTVDVSNGVFRLDSGDGNGFEDKPLVTFNSGTTYVFDQSHDSNANNTLVIGTAPDISSSIVSSGLTIMGTPGQPGAYTKYVSDGSTVYYFSYQTENMGEEPPMYTVIAIDNEITGEKVFSLKAPGTSTFISQPDLSFGPGDKYQFNVLDSTMAEFTLVFGTIVDDISTRNESVVTRASGSVILDLTDYAGDRLVYFEDSSANMGYVSPSSSATIYTVSVSNGAFNLDSNDGNGPVLIPNIIFVANTTYVFDQSNETNLDNQLVIGTEPDISSSIVTTGLTIVGTPGKPGAYTQYVTGATPPTVYYFSYQNNYMGYQTPFTLVSTSKDSIYPGQSTVITVENTTPTDGAYTLTLTDIIQSDLNGAALTGSIPKQSITEFTYTLSASATNVGSFTYSIDNTGISSTVQVTEAPPIIKYTVEVSGGIYWLQQFDYIGAIGLKQAQPALPQFELGTQYEFHYTDSNHPIRLSTTIDGTHGSGGVEYTTGVTKEEDSTDVNVTPYKLILVAEENVTLHYYCSAHSGYGDTGTSASHATYDDVLGIHFTFDDYIDLDAEFATVNSVTLNNKGTFGTAGNGTIHKGATQSLSFSSTEKKVGNYSLYNSNNTQKGGYLGYIGLSGTIGYDNGLSGSTTGFTFMAWVYEEPGTYDYTLWMGHHGLGYKCGFILNNIVCGNQIAVKSTDPLRAANVNSWHHFAFRALPNYTKYNNMDLALVEAYYDGVKRSGWTPLDHREREFPLQLHGFRLVAANSNDYGMKGYLDDIRLYNEWLPESEIQRISGFLIPYTLSATTDFVFPNNLTYNVVMDTVYITVTNKNSFDGSYTVTLGGNVSQSDINNASLSGSIPAKATTVYKYTIPSNVTNTGFFVFSIDGTDHSTTVEVLDGPKIGDTYDVEVISGVYWLQRKDDFGPLGSNYQQPLLPEYKFGLRYEFHYTDNTHPIRLSTTIDGTHGSGVEYTTGVTVEESADTGVTPHKLILIAEEDVTLHYYCDVHSGYGDTGTSTAYITYLDNMKIRYTFDISTNLVSGQNANVTNSGSAGASGDATLYPNGSATHTISYDADAKVGSYSLYNNTDANGGSSGYLGLPNMSLSNSNGFTYMMWIKVINANNGPWASYVNISNEHIYGYSLFYRPHVNTGTLSIGASGSYLQMVTDGSTSVIGTGWHHYAVSGSSGYLVKGYVDGQLVTSELITGAIDGKSWRYGPINTTNGIKLFASQTVYGALKGYMDDIRFYDEQLPDSEILRVYNETV